MLLHIRNTPKLAAPMGAFIAALMPKPSTCNSQRLVGILHWGSWDQQGVRSVYKHIRGMEPDKRGKTRPKPAWRGGGPPVVCRSAE
jgi:hypothetical protein